MVNSPSVDPDRKGINITKSLLDKWLFELKLTVKGLESTILAKDAENETLKARIKELEQPKKNLMSSLFSSSKEDQRAVISTVNREIREKQKIESNVVISGVVDNNNEEDDKKTVEDVLKALDVEPSTSKHRRITVKFTKDNAGNLLKPYEMILVVLDSNASQQKALQNAKNLKNNPSFSKYYVNPDKTENERKIEQFRRLERNRRNDSLSHVIMDGEGRPTNKRISYDKNKANPFYWGIRCGEFRKI